MTWPGVAPELVASLLVCLKICGYISSHNAILYIDIVLTIAWIFAWSFSRETKPDSAIEQAISVSFRTLKRLSSSSWCDALTPQPVLSESSSARRSLFHPNTSSILQSRRPLRILTPDLCWYRIAHGRPSPLLYNYKSVDSGVQGTRRTEVLSCVKSLKKDDDGGVALLCKA
jgi:hypothetical protein